MDLEHIKRNLFGDQTLSAEIVKVLYGRLKSLTNHEMKVSTVFETQVDRKKGTLQRYEMLFEGQYYNWKKMVDLKCVPVQDQFQQKHNIQMFIRLLQNKKIMGTSYLPYYEHYYIFGYNAGGVLGQVYEDLSLDSLTRTLEQATVSNWFGPIMKNFVVNAPIGMAVMVLNSYPEAARPLMQIVTNWAQRHLNNFDAPMVPGSIALPYQNGQYACPFCLHIGDEDQMVSHLSRCLLVQCGIIKTKSSYRCSQLFIDNYYKAVIGTKNGLQIVDAREYKTVGYMSPFHTWSNFVSSVNNPISVHSLNAVFTKSDVSDNDTVPTMFAGEDARVKIPCFACDFSYLLQRPCALSLKFSGYDADCVVCGKPGGKSFKSIGELIAVTLGVAIPEQMEIQQPTIQLIQDRTLIKNVVNNAVSYVSPISGQQGPPNNPIIKLINHKRCLQILATASLPNLALKLAMRPDLASPFASLMRSLGVSLEEQYREGWAQRRFRSKRGVKGRKKPHRICATVAFQKTRPRLQLLSLPNGLRKRAARRVEISKWMEYQFGRAGIAFHRYAPIVEPGTIGFG